MLRITFFRRLIFVIHNPVVNDAGLDKDLGILQPGPVFTITGEAFVHQEHPGKKVCRNLDRKTSAFNGLLKRLTDRITMFVNGY